MSEVNTLDWLEPVATAWRAAVTAGRAPHAVLLTGAPGVGKRAFAAWLANEQLSVRAHTALPQQAAAPLLHPDLYWVQPPEDKHSILIEQIRELVSELALTSHSGRGKVAVIEPADAMTASAADSLLKTLEEPAGEALLVLVADRSGRLPPTVRSRCQQLFVATPAEPLARAWLDRLRPGANWTAALRQAAGAPLAALAALERLEQTATMARDFAGVAERRASPVEVAGRWAGEDPRFVLEWLARQVQQCIHRVSGSDGGGAEVQVTDSVLSRIDRRNLFCYLDIINGLRGRPPASFSVQLTLEGLLIDWAGGLKNVGQPRIS